MNNGKARSVRWAGRGLIVLAASVAWIACHTNTLGEIARTGVCPDGETCVRPLTGARFGLIGQHIAVGGRQRVEVVAPVDGYIPLWTAISGDASIFEIESQRAPEVVLRGVGPGHSFLRIIDDDDLLIDRIPMGAHPVASAVLRASVRLLVTDPWTGPFVFMRGTEQPVWATLLDADGQHLVDIDASFVATEGVIPEGWNRATVTFVDGSFPLTIETGAGERFPIEATVVDRIDRIRRVAFYGQDIEGPITMRAGSLHGARAIFFSTVGDAAVIGATLLVASPRSVTTEVEMDGARTTVRFTSETPGDYSVAIFGAGAALTVDVTVTDG